MPEVNDPSDAGLTEACVLTVSTGADAGPLSGWELRFS